MTLFLVTGVSKHRRAFRIYTFYIQRDIHKQPTLQLVEVIPTVFFLSQPPSPAHKSTFVSPSIV